MRGLLVVNPVASAATARSRDALLGALAGTVETEVAETEHRGHAAELAADARRDGVDVVVVLGGDGTVNEVVNGLLGEDPTRERPTSGVPALAVVPCGGTNVLARSLGLPRDAAESVDVLLDALRTGRRRTVGLGRADGRWFTFGAGFGLDAEVVADMERRRAAGRPASAALYVVTGVRRFFARGRSAAGPLRLERPTEPPVAGLHVVIVTNTAPWTYLGNRPVDPTPHARFDTGLDVFGLRSLGTASTLRHIRQILTADGRPPRGRTVVSLHDLDRFTVIASRPTAFELDGDFLGTRSRVTLEAVPRALTLVL
jgi:diacylglycerol kinase family enzyme